jgi:surface antigen
MRVSSTSIAVLALVGSAGFAPGAEAAKGRASHQASSQHATTTRAPAYHGTSHYAARPMRSINTSYPSEGFGSDWSSNYALGRVYASQGYASQGYASQSYAGQHYPGLGQAEDSSFGGRPRGGLQCVPYARQVSGIEVRGNARYWWSEAAGRYDRGSRPEPGAVMAFRASGGMRNGHVAVVSKVLGPRQVQIDHANWSGPGLHKGSIMHNANVVDVSPGNDWTEVRVQLGYDEGAYGRVYPTHGFIYNRPDNGGPVYAGGPTRRSLQIEQVAEMPVGGVPTSYQPLGLDSLRRR